MSAWSGRGWLTAATTRLELIALAALSLGAAAIHFGVIAEHYAEYPLFGAFFSLVGWFQALWAIAYVIRPAWWLTVIAVAANAVTVLVWIWAHVVGLPFGPDPGALEPTTITDLMATLFELLLIGGLVALVGGRAALPGRAASQLAERRRPTTVAVAATAVLVASVIIGTTVALAQPTM